MDLFQRKHCIVCKTNFGSEAKKWMCNSCYQTHLDEEQIKKCIDLSQSDTKKPNETSTEVSTDNLSSASSQVIQTDTSKCWTCSKKVGYLGFKCKCGYTFCGSHRHFSDHKCEFDYKSYDRERLNAKNDFHNKK